MQVEVIKGLIDMRNKVRIAIRAYRVANKMADKFPPREILRKHEDLIELIDLEEELSQAIRRMAR